ncbi:MAG: hypothetical protein ACRDV3_16740 [Acidothermaceae bacterium]
MTGDCGDCDVPARTFRAAVFAAVAVVLLLMLRATSDGAGPSLLVVCSSFGLVTALARPLTSRERSLPVVFAGLVATQFALHVLFLFAATGQLAHPGGVGLVCSPAATSSTSCLPTERGGLVLLGVQLLAALGFAWWVRGADAIGWQLARRPDRIVRAIIASIARMLVKALSALVPEPAVSVAPQAKSVPVPALPIFAVERPRRGPPRRRAASSFSSAFSASARHAFSF